MKMTLIFIVMAIQFNYDRMILVSEDLYAALSSLSWISLLGWIFYRLIDDALECTSKLKRDVYYTLSSYFLYRCILNLIGFAGAVDLKNMNLKREGSWDFYNAVTSNQYIDFMVWSVIFVILISLVIIHRNEFFQKSKLLCRKLIYRLPF